MKLIKTFNKISKKDVAIAGGKGASLGEMTQAKISVPEGFVILSDTFDNFIQENAIKSEVDSILKKVNIEDMNSINNASEKIKYLILNAKIPNSISRKILESFKVLNSKFVAVRSSATSEDSEDAAWAGQLDTFLNTTKANLLKDVKGCWASLFTPRAIFYRFEKKLEESEISVAVVVQKMIQSEISGIAFSVHPVTQNKNQILIEAGLGLGEAIVSGQITPDSYVVKKDSLEIEEINVNKQTKKLEKKRDKNAWIEMKKEGEKRFLDDKKIDKLAKLIIQIEKHYGFPCDIEWAYEKGKFYITQSRPITTLSEDIEDKVISKKDYPILTKLKKYTFEKHMVYPKIPAIYIDSIWRCYFNNPFFEKFGIKDYQGMIGILGNQYEDWQSIPLKKIIKTNKDAKWIVSKSRDYLVKNKNFFEEFLPKKFLDANDVADFLNKVDTVSTELNQFFLFYMEECFDITDERLLRELPEVRDEISNFVGDYLFKSYDKILEFVASKFKVSNKVLWLCTSEEICRILQGELDVSKIKEERDNLIVFVPLGKNLEIFRGTDALEIKNFLEKQDPNKNSLKEAELSKKFGGNVAYKGEVNGKVIVIATKDYGNYEKIFKDKKDFVLVAPMTRPEIVSYMKRASAIITDEGGITCHAAIVSRELKIPCIVGTKIATKILKDGDLVEIDAEKGIVKILKKS